MTGGAVIALGVTLYVGLRKETPNPTPASTPTAPVSKLSAPTVRLGVGGNGVLVVCAKRARDSVGV